MKSTIAMLSLLILVSCGKDGQNGVNGIDRSPAFVQPTLIQEVLQEENDYRYDNGQTLLSKGLSCNLKTFTGGDRLQPSIAGHNTFNGLINVSSYTFAGSFDQAETSVNDGLNAVLPSLNIKTNYVLKCTGYLVITDNDYYKFDLTSDDASLLYIGNSLVIDNDNAHAVTDKTATKYLRRGVYSFRLDYAQNTGNQALTLKMNNSIIESERFAN